MSPVITLFCEGANSSLDYKILSKLDPVSTILVPSGGKNGLSAFMNGYGASPRVTSKEFFRAFRDRDFDYDPGGGLLIRDGKFLIPCRTMIENYLLHPTTLFDYIQAKGSKKARLRIGHLSDAEELFREAFKNLRFYSAARWAHGSIKRQDKKSFTFNSNWPKDSGDIPKNIGDTDCRIILGGIIGDIREKINQLNLEVFEQNYAEFVAKFNDPFFQNIDLCLIWFNGKDVAKMLYMLLGEPNCFLGGETGDYYDFALNPSRFRVEVFPDLVELRDILNGTMPL